MRVLIVKMSSMGDIIHTLPAIHDASIAWPNIQFDWVVEEAFTEIPLWHKNVHNVITIALRRWKKHLWQGLQRHDIQNFFKKLRSQHYDQVLDAQGSLKSAITTRLSHGYRVGFDKHTTRERFAHLAYQKTIFVPQKQHAINRTRQLLAQSLGYPLPLTLPCYGIDTTQFNTTKFNLPKDFLMFIPNTSQQNKEWPEHDWSFLAKQTAQKKIPVVIPSGNEEEKKRALRIRARYASVNVLPLLNLSTLAYVLSRAKVVVSVDTGLSHLAAALDVPGITLYGPTNPELIGTLGRSQIHKPLETSAENLWECLSGLL